MASATAAAFAAATCPRAAAAEGEPLWPAGTVRGFGFVTHEVVDKRRM